MSIEETGPDNATPSPVPAGDLRERAEEVARQNAAQVPETWDTLSPDSARQALHELRVHQIELEMQNEELRRAQAELEASRARYFDLYELAPVGYVTVSEEGLILEANLTAATLLGVARAVLVKRPLAGFIVAEDQDTYYRHRKQLFETDEPQTCEFRMLRAGVGPFWARVEATVSQDARAAPVYRGALSDIGAQKQAEKEKAELELQNQQLQKADSLGRMAGAIAHTFNNQLQVVMGYLELGMNELHRDEKSCFQNLTASMRAAHRAAEVSGLMLTYLGQSTASHELLDLAATCRQRLPMLLAAMPKDVRLETELPSPGPAVSANANQVQQVLTNLLTNAWEAAGNRPGAIHLRVRTISRTEIPAAHRFPVDWRPKDSAYACLEVQDVGSGIAEHDIEKIFDPFYSTKFTGRGLGLAVVLGIVRAHHGVVTVESELGRGSVFRVFFPLSAEEAPSSMDDATQIPLFEGSGKLLLVDDEEMVRQLAENMLTRLGFAPLVASGGAEAVELLRQHKDDIRCVLCDLTMPRMDGWKVLAAVRQLAPDMPVILSSGYAEEQAMAGEHAEWPEAFLGKPYQMDRLSDAISRALAIR